MDKCMSVVGELSDKTVIHCGKVIIGRPGFNTMILNGGLKCTYFRPPQQCESCAQKPFVTAFADFIDLPKSKKKTGIITAKKMVNWGFYQSLGCEQKNQALEFLHSIGLMLVQSGFQVLVGDECKNPRTRYTVYSFPGERSAHRYGKSFFPGRFTIAPYHFEAPVPISPFRKSTKALALVGIG